jgi:hypothetical protein
LGEEVLMALFYGQHCPLCGTKMKEKDQLFGTSHFLEPDNDLYIYSDAVMHWDCYAQWEHRERFAQMYFDSVKKSRSQNPYWGVAYSDKYVLVITNPTKYVSEVHIALASTGSILCVPLAEWEDWLSRDWSKGCAHEIEREGLKMIIPLLLSKFPSAAAVVKAAGMEKEAESEVIIEDEIVSRILHERAFRQLTERATTKGITCPSCRNFSREYDFVQVEQISESGPESYLVCLNCKKKFGPADV